jgi:hypothetical protein
MHFQEQCFGSRSGLDSDSNGIADPNPGWDPGSRQANIVPNIEEISCLKSSLLVWRLFLEPECPV